MIWSIVFNIFLFLFGIYVGVKTLVLDGKKNGYIIDDKDGNIKWKNNKKIGEK